MKEFRLKDLYLCGFLVNEGQNLIRMDNDGSKFWFIFEDNSKLNELINAYWENTATTKIKSYIDNVRSLKDRIFSEK